MMEQSKAFARTLQREAHTNLGALPPPADVSDLVNTAGSQSQTRSTHDRFSAVSVLEREATFAVHSWSCRCTPPSTTRPSM